MATGSSLKKDLIENFKEVGFLLFIFAVCAMIVTGCNQQIVDLNYKFSKAIIAIPGSNTNKVVKVKKWNDYPNSDMVQVIADDGSVYYGHSNNILLIKEK